MRQAWPEAFLKDVQHRLGDEFPAFLRECDQPPVRGLRLNPLKPLRSLAGVDGVEEPIPWARDGRYLSGASRAGAHPLHEAGAYYIQEPSAMLPAAVLCAQPGELVLDLCAAPGGKTTQIGADMAGKGLLVCNEPVRKRAMILSRNVERMGITNALVISSMPDRIARQWPESFDAVLVDAPCSGEGMFRRLPEARLAWSSDAVEGCAARQAEILDAAALLVRPGGRLVYSTCTLNRIENEETVFAFLLRHREFSLSPFELPSVSAPEGMLTCWPHRMRGEGQFVAQLYRSGDGVARLPMETAPKLTREERKAVESWLLERQDCIWPTEGGYVCLSMHPVTGSLPVLRRGVHMLERRGKVWVPDHAWAVSALPPGFPRIPLSEAEARSYQAGEILHIAPDWSGWVLPELEGLALGLGKAVEGVMKNHYPKGLRRQSYPEE